MLYSFEIPVFVVMFIVTPRQNVVDRLANECVKWAEAVRANNISELKRIIAELSTLHVSPMELRTAKGIGEHNVDHCNYRSWCELCVDTRAAGEPNRRGKFQQPAVTL